MLCTLTTQQNPAVNKFLLQMKPVSFMQIYNKILKAFTLILPIFPQFQKQTATTIAEMKSTVAAFFKTLFLEKL